MPNTSAHAQSDYQVRLEWGEAGLARLAPADVVVVVQTLGLTAHALSACEHGAGLDLTDDADAAASLARAAEAAGAHVVIGGLRNAAAVAAHVMAVQHERGARTSISVIAAGSVDDADAAGVRFAVDDLLGAGAVVAALGALVLAFAEVFSIYLVPSYLTAAVGFVLLVVVLIVRPAGLFGQRELT